MCGGIQDYDTNPRTSGDPGGLATKAVGIAVAMSLGAFAGNCLFWSAYWSGLAIFDPDAWDDAQLDGVADPSLIILGLVLAVPSLIAAFFLSRGCRVAHWWWIGSAATVFALFSFIFVPGLI